MMNTLYLPELREMLSEGDSHGLREFCEALHPARTAEFMEGLNAAETWSVLQAAEPIDRAEIFSYLPEELQVEILESAEPSEASVLVADLPPDDAVDVLNRADPEAVEALLPLVPAEERRDLLRLRAYPEGTAGALMTTDIARLQEGMTAREALDEIARQAEELETIYYIYIVDNENHLRGLVSARQLVTSLAKPGVKVDDLMERNLVTVEATDDQEAVVEKVANYDFLAIPVVDNEQHLVGIITHDDVIDVMQEEATEDAHLAGAVEPLPDGYISTPVVRLIRARASWLTVLFAAALVTAKVLQSYHKTLENIEWLVWFVPVLISSGGNTGSQSATLVIRALTTKEVSPTDWVKIVVRELASGLLLGLFLGVIGYAAGLFLIPNAVDALVLPITLVLVVMSGALLGATLPLVFQRLGLDPALMSSPFVAGIIDIVGIVLYLSVARMLLSEGL